MRTKLALSLLTMGVLMSFTTGTTFGSFTDTEASVQNTFGTGVFNSSTNESFTPEPAEEPGFCGVRTDIYEGDISDPGFPELEDPEFTEPEIELDFKCEMDFDRFEEPPFEDHAESFP